MQLPQVDALDAQALEAAFEVLANLFRPAVGVPASRARTGEAALGGDDQALRIGMQRLGDQRLVGLRPVALGGIEEVHAQFGGAAQHPVRVLAVARLAPDVVVVDHAHGAETEAVDFELAELHRNHSRAWFSSAIRSSTLSMPTDRRTSPSSMPRSARTSSGSEACVMIAGCSIRLSTPPRLSARVNRWQRSRNRREALIAPSLPPFSTMVTMPP